MQTICHFTLIYTVPISDYNIYIYHYISMGAVQVVFSMMLQSQVSSHTHNISQHTMIPMPIWQLKTRRSLAPLHIYGILIMKQTTLRWFPTMLVSVSMCPGPNIYPLVICYIAIENTTFIVDFPSYKMVDLSIVMCMFTRGYTSIFLWFPYGFLWKPPFSNGFNGKIHYKWPFSIAM